MRVHNVVRPSRSADSRWGSASGRKRVFVGLLSLALVVIAPALVLAERFVCRESDGVLRLSGIPCFAGDTGTVTPMAHGSASSKAGQSPATVGQPAGVRSSGHFVGDRAKPTDITWRYEDGTTFTLHISPCELTSILSCDNITSCSEARFFLRECGYTGLDSDGDGIPCDELCQPESPEP